jgi:D-lactate dehydrogenase
MIRLGHTREFPPRFQYESFEIHSKKDGGTSMERCGRIFFFEMEKWGIDFLHKREVGGDYAILDEPLEVNNVARASEADVVSIFIYSQVDRQILEALPRVKLIATRSTGHDHIDLSACAKRGITVSNVPRYGENTVAEHAFGLILALSRKIYQGALRTARLDFRSEGLRGFDLKGKTLGVVGAGAIGLHLIRMAKGFGMEVVASDAQPQRLLAEVLGFRYVPIEQLLAVSDVISIHIPLTSQTHHLIDAEAFGLMKRGAILINTARGEIVDTKALVNALNDGQLAGAGLDVLEGEETIKEEAELLAETLPPEKARQVVQSYALLNRDNVIITPHTAFYSREAEERIMETTVENIRSFCEGSPQNTVSLPLIRAALRRPSAGNRKAS